MTYKGGILLKDGRNEWNKDTILEMAEWGMIFGFLIIMFVLNKLL